MYFDNLNEPASRADLRVIRNQAYFGKSRNSDHGRATVRRGVNVFRKLFAKPRSVHFLHVGKCGGTAVKDLAERVNQLPSGPRIAAHGHSTKLKDLPPDAPYFFAVRDPVTRFYSAFYMRKQKEQPRLYREWSDAERDAYEHFPEANDLAENLFAETPLGGQAFAAMQSIGHMTYQHSWFNIREILEKRPPLTILRQECLAQDVVHLLQILGVSTSLGLPEDNTRAHRNDYSNIPRPSDAAITNLKRWYAVDIEYYRILNEWVEKNRA